MMTEIETKEGCQKDVSSKKRRDHKQKKQKIVCLLKNLNVLWISMANFFDPFLENRFQLTNKTGFWKLKLLDIFFDHLLLTFGDSG